MLKDYLEAQGITIYKLSKKSKVPYSTLNDLVNYKLSVENIRAGQLKNIADVLRINLDSLYDMCVYKKNIYSKKHKIYANIEIEKRRYFLTYERNGKEYHNEIIPVKGEATEYIELLATWKLDEEIEKLEMEDVYESIYFKTQR